MADVAATFDDLERKLLRLEHELRRAFGVDAPPEPESRTLVPGSIRPSPPAVRSRADVDAVMGQATERLERLGGRIDELLRHRDDLQRSVSRLMDEYERAVDRFEAVREPQDVLYEGAVELDAGPFGDIAAVGAFERALAAQPAVAAAGVRRFGGGRALLDIRLSAPVALLREVETATGRSVSVLLARGARVAVALGG